MADVPDISVLEKELHTPLGEGGGMFCGVTEEAFAINGVTYKWPRGSLLTWGIAFSRLGSLSDMDCKDAITEFLKEHSAACDINHKYISNANAANIKMIATRLDGRSGVLADAQIPVGNVTPDTQLLMRFDDGENWGISSNPPSGMIDFYAVGSHEWLHIEGLGHKPPSIQEPALISPVYSARIRHLQPADKSELVRRYGSTKTPPPPPPTGGKPVNFKGIQEIEQDGKIWRGTVTGILQRVT